MTVVGETVDVAGHDLIRWLRESWTHRFIAYTILVLTLSLVVQVIATVFLVGGS
jgi:hypothetical protein